MRRRLFVLTLVLSMLLALCGGCGNDDTQAVSSAASAPEISDSSTGLEAAGESEEASAVEANAGPESEEAGEVPVEAAVDLDFTESNAQMDFRGFQEMLRSLTTELPVVEEPVTLSYFLGFDTETLRYIPGGALNGHQIWSALEDITGVRVDLHVVEDIAAADRLNLMLASGDYTDLINMSSYASGIDTAFDRDFIMELEDYLEEDMPNYWTIIHSDEKLLREVQDGGKFLAVYPVKDEVANPADMGAFIRMDWLEELGMDVPVTYDELTAVLEAFQTEKGATEPLALYNTINMDDGLLMGGFGSLAELSANGVGGSALNGYYQEDGQVIYGATADGTRKFLSWLHVLYEKGLIDFVNMQNRYVNPYGALTAIACASGSVGYMYTTQSFGGGYCALAAYGYGDWACNWWPVQDVAEKRGQEIPFFEDVTLVDSRTAVLCVSSQCENVETALKFLDYGYSYEGSLLYNFGYQKGSGHQVESWDFNAKGQPEFDPTVLELYGATATGATVLTTRDLGGVMVETRFSFEASERAKACFDAWKTNKAPVKILGSDTRFTEEEQQAAAGIYSDILTYVASSALQFINGDLDVDNDRTWNNYVSAIEGMDLASLTELVQAAYDRARE